MMRKTMAIALFMLVTAVVGATPNENKGRWDQSALQNMQRIHGFITADTSAVPDYTVSNSNSIYSRRLDSIRKSVPLTYNEFVQRYIDIYLDRKEQIGKMLGLSKYYFPIFEKALKELNIPEEIKYLSVIESALDPHAVSRVGATGPWQFMFATAKGYGLLIDNYVDERKDPIAASYAAAAYFRDAYSQFGDWLLAIAAYNCGSGNVRRAIARSGGKTDFWAIRSFLPLETRNYVPAFIATVYVMNYYLRHDITPRPANFSIYTDTIPVNKFISISRISQAANINADELRILNPSYKKQIINGSVAKPKRLVIPKVDRELFTSLYNALNDLPEGQSPRVLLASNTDDRSLHSSMPASHRVKPGETLLTIANHYRVEVQDLKVWNNLKSVTLVPGQLLKLRPQQAGSGFITYEVQNGDTLNDIAERFRGSASEIKALNGLKDGVVKPGMLLKINKA